MGGRSSTTWRPPEERCRTLSEEYEIDDLLVILDNLAKGVRQEKTIQCSETRKIMHRIWTLDKLRKHQPSPWDFGCLFPGLCLGRPKLSG